MIPRVPIPTLFPYTTLFRSGSRLRTRPRCAAVYDDRKPGSFRQFAPPARAWVKEPKRESPDLGPIAPQCGPDAPRSARQMQDRKSTRLNSSHPSISYAVFCLNDPSRTDTYTLSLHDALPIWFTPPNTTKVRSGV